MAVKLSPRQQEILDELLVSTPELVARNLDIEENTVHQTLKRIRKKYRDARNFVNMMDSRYRNKAPLKQYLWMKEFGQRSSDSL